MIFKIKQSLWFNALVIGLLFLSLIIMAFKLRLTTKHHLELKTQFERNIEVLFHVSLDNSKYSNLLLFDVKTESIDGNSSTLLENVGDREKLILWYPLSSCGSCLGNILEGFRKLSDDLGEENCFILTNNPRKRELHNFLDINKLNCKLYISDPFKGQKIRNKDPIIFIIDHNNRIKNPFVVTPQAKRFLPMYFNNTPVYILCPSIPASFALSPGEVENAIIVPSGAFTCVNEVEAPRPKLCLHASMIIILTLVDELFRISVISVNLIHVLSQTCLFGFSTGHSIDAK